MKRLFLFLILVSPWLVRAQDNPVIFETTYLTALPSQNLRFEAAVAAHDKKYHASGPHGVRVYSVISGKNAGQYTWVMGPGHWSDLDTRPNDADNHNLDWTTNVLPNLTPQQNTQYFSFDSKRSHFPHDFDLKKVFFYYWDIIPNADWEKVNALLDKVHQVYMEKLPDETYGIYRSELPSSSEGKDIVMGFFFDNYAWMGIDNGFSKKYEEVFGKDAWKTFLADWNSQVKGLESEIWEYREDLSGLGPTIPVADRQ